MKKAVMVLLVLLAVMMAGCTDRDSLPEPVDLKEKEMTLKIVAHNPDKFQDLFLEPVKLYFPKLQLDVIGWNPDVAWNDPEALRDWLEQERPDLLVTDGLYHTLAAAGLIVPLDPWIERDGVDLDAYVPGVIDWLKEHSADHRLYGLASFFRSKMLYFNKPMFAQYGVPLPEGELTWEELLQLVARFPSGESDGLWLGTIYISPAHLILEIGRTQELQLTDAEGNVTANTEAWRSIWELVLQACRAETLHLDDWNDDGWPRGVISRSSIDPFPVIIEYGYEVAYESISGKWEIGAYPVHPLYPESNHTLEPTYIFSIYSQSANSAYAWELLKFVTGMGYARFTRGFQGGFLSSHKEVLRFPGYEQLEVLTEQHYRYRPQLGLVRDGEFISQWNRWFYQVVDGVMTLEEAMAKWEDLLRSVLAKP